MLRHEIAPNIHGICMSTQSDGVCVWGVRCRSPIHSFSIYYVTVMGHNKNSIFISICPHPGRKRYLMHFYWIELDWTEWWTFRELIFKLIWTPPASQNDDEYFHNWTIIESWWEKLWYKWSRRGAFNMKWIIEYSIIDYRYLMFQFQFVQLNAIIIRLIIVDTAHKITLSSAEANENNINFPFGSVDPPNPSFGVT